MASDEARVTVREVIDDQMLEAVWIYRYTDQGWRHIASEGQPWDRLTRRTTTFDVSYEAMDAVYVDATLAILNRWWKIVQDDNRVYRRSPSSQAFVHVEKYSGWLGQSGRNRPANSHR